MIDATNVGISPLMTTPMTTSYATTPGVETTTYLPGVQDVSSYTTGAQVVTGVPTTIGTQVVDPNLYGTQVIDQGLVGTQVIDQGLVGTQVVDPNLYGTQVIDQGLVGTQVIDQGLVGTQVVDPNLYGTQVIDQGLVGTQVVDPNLALVGTTTPLVTDTTLMQVPSPDLQGVQYITDPGTQVITSVVNQPVVDPLLVSSTGGLTGSMLPPVTSPELVSANPLAQTTGSYVSSTPIASSITQPTGYGTSTMGGTQIIPPPIQQVTPAPQAPIGPIMDEDFQRGRPIYDEFSEDRYRGFRFGV